MEEVRDDDLLAAMGLQDTGEPPEAEEVEEQEVEAPEEEPREEAPVVAEDDKPVPLKALQEERKKRQELERKLEELSKGVQDLKPAAPTAPPKDIYEAYDRDPEGVVTSLNAQLQKLVADDPYGNAATIEQLRDIKDNLRRREVDTIKSNLSKQSVAAESLTAVQTAIPDFRQRVEPLTKFAVEELGYTPDELVTLTDLSKGASAVREILRINKLYEKLNATPVAKEVKPKPTEVEASGKGIQKQAPSRDKLLQEARKTGNWENYFDAMGLLD